jgi:ATP-dependent HslUV protease, peptidase subunit HslV
MSTLVVVKKNRQVCIAADTLTTFGSRWQRAAYVANPDKIQKIGEAYIGIVGSAAHEHVIESIFSKTKKIPNFQNRLEIFEFFRKLHPRLKNKYFLNPTDDDDDPYESSQMDLFIANPYGIFGVFSLREIDEYQKFWAIGSGSDYALGAMYATYEQCEDAEQIARIGVEAGVEFDDASDAPITTYTIDLI